MRPNLPAATRDKAIAFANNVSQNVRSCAELQAVASRVGAFYMSLGVVNPKNLSAQVQAALAKSEPGSIAPPFFSSDGIELIARCEPRVDPIELIEIPTPEKMRAQLFQQRAGMLARSYLRDLRRDAVIETR
jgi:peptidyl-prolyl cis-trans isomerase SurA